MTYALIIYSYTDTEAGKEKAKELSDIADEFKGHYIFSSMASQPAKDAAIKEHDHATLVYFEEWDPMYRFMEKVYPFDYVSALRWDLLGDPVGPW
ncbi:MAG: hypothetical protein KKE20_01015 [Nanoarchaeota archaeon]|nr:hypothetical protein [Nanoarchaeota archaeon]